MEIKIHTAKKKLTKSTIRQMQAPTILTMENGDVMGYMINVEKNSFKTILICYASEYFTIESNWKKGEKSIYRRAGKWSQNRTFKKTVDCDIWWNAYQRILKNAKIQIYI